MNALRQLRLIVIQGLLVGLCACGGQAGLNAPPQAAPGSSDASGVGTVTQQMPAYSRDNPVQRGALLRSRVRKAQNVPLVIPVSAFAGAGAKDPGAIPDRHLFSMLLDNSAYTDRTLASNCPGVSATSVCQPYKYINFLDNYCANSVTLAAYQWADSNDESGFLHVYPGAKTLQNRFNSGPNKSGFHCEPHNPNNIMFMNASDARLISWIYNNVWNGSNYDNDFPSPYGAMEDNASVLAWLIVGDGKGGQVSTEYGSGTSPSGFANQVGKGPYHDATDYETAIGTFINGACGAKCLNMAINGVATGAGPAGSCSDIANGHCHVAGSAGIIDDQAGINNVCSTVKGGNLKYFMAERPVYSGRFGVQFLDTQTLVYGINTNANLYSHTSDGCKSAQLIDIETSYGANGRGDVTGGYRVRLAALAWRWLVANPSTGIPDRVISQQSTEGGTSSEIPYFFEDTLVPDGAEVSVPKFVWNGKVQTIGGGCPSKNGDSGGAVAILSQCVGSSGIYCQQYGHLYVNDVDHGKMAVCLNTSTTTEHVVSSWFKHDPISSYHYMLSLKGGEMTSLPFVGVSGGSISLPCTNKTYCTGSNSLSAQTTSFNQGYALCGVCGLVLLENN